MEDLQQDYGASPLINENVETQRPKKGLLYRLNRNQKENNNSVKDFVVNDNESQDKKHSKVPKVFDINPTSDICCDESQESEQEEIHSSNNHGANGDDNQS